METVLVNSSPNGDCARYDAGLQGDGTLHEVGVAAYRLAITLAACACWSCDSGSGAVACAGRECRSRGGKPDELLVEDRQERGPRRRAIRADADLPVMETTALKAVPNLSEIEPTSIQLTPFDVLAGTRHEDIVAPPWRYLQYRVHRAAAGRRVLRAGHRHPGDERHLSYSVRGRRDASRAPNTHMSFRRCRCGFCRCFRRRLPTSEIRPWIRSAIWKPDASGPRSNSWRQRFSSVSPPFSPIVGGSASSNDFGSAVPPSRNAAGRDRAGWLSA